MRRIFDLQLKAVNDSIMSMDMSIQLLHIELEFEPPTIIYFLNPFSFFDKLKTQLLVLQ